MKNSSVYELLEVPINDSSSSIKTLYGLKSNFEFVEASMPNTDDEGGERDFEDYGDDDDGGLESLPVKSKGK